MTSLTRFILCTCLLLPSAAAGQDMPADYAAVLKTVGKHVPPPAGVRPPTLWGDEDHLRGLLGADVDALRTERRTYTFRYRSPEHFVDFFEAYYGPTHKAFAALDDLGREALRADIVELVHSYDRLGDDDTAVAITAEYLQAVGTRAG